MGVIYDLELAELILKELKFIYGIDDSTEVYKYFICRYVCSEIDNYSKMKKDLKNLLYNMDSRKKIVNFTLNELNLVNHLDFFTYKDLDIYKYRAGSNSMINCLTELESICIDFFKKDYFYEDVKTIIDKIYSSANRKSSSKKGSSNYKHYLVYYSLQNLNKHFSIDDIKDSLFYQEIGFVQSVPSIKIEDRCGRFIDSESGISNDALKIDEDILEKYIYKNLHLIEDGLKPIKRQYIIRDGRIDILAKDKNDIYTIIELKVEHDPDLIFQCIHYPTQLKLEKKLSNVRVITISPEYTYGILNSLKHIHKDFNIESYVCLIKVKGIKNKRIDSVKLIRAF